MSNVDFSQIEDVGNKHQITAKTQTGKGNGSVGRPEKDIEKKRKNRIVVYLTDEEYKRVDDMAQSKNKTLSQYIRDELCGVKGRYV